MLAVSSARAEPYRARVRGQQRARGSGKPGQRMNRMKSCRVGESSGRKQSDDSGYAWPAGSNFTIVSACVSLLLASAILLTDRDSTPPPLFAESRSFRFELLSARRRARSAARRAPTAPTGSAMEAAAS